jgi:hypothetical protein
VNTEERTIIDGNVHERRRVPLAPVIAPLGLASVASLLAWVFGLGTFSAWFWWFSFPAMVALATVGGLATRHGARPQLLLALRAGIVGGLLGTVGYDLFRVPFHLAGFRLLAPIDSYGVLILGAEGSSALSGFVGWCYHFSNGIGFGIAYAVVALGRRRWWAIAWAMVLETATVATPFAGTYAIAGKWHIIAIAYAAHVAYGWPLGRWVEDAPRRVGDLAQAVSRPVAATLGALSVGLLLWHQPWSADGDDRAGEAVASGPSAVVRGGRLAPTWVRLGVGECAAVRNDDDVTHRLSGAEGTPSLEPDRITDVCFTDDGVHRVRTSSKPDAGGYVIVDPERRT